MKVGGVRTAVFRSLEPFIGLLASEIGLVGIPETISDVAWSDSGVPAYGSSERTWPDAANSR